MEVLEETCENSNIEEFNAIPYDEEFVEDRFVRNGNTRRSLAGVDTKDNMLNMDYAYHANL